MWSEFKARVQAIRRHAAAIARKLAAYAKKSCRMKWAVSLSRPVSDLILLSAQRRPPRGILLQSVAAGYRTARRRLRAARQSPVRRRWHRHSNQHCGAGHCQNYRLICHRSGRSGGAKRFLIDQPRQKPRPANRTGENATFRARAAAGLTLAARGIESLIKLSFNSPTYIPTSEIRLRYGQRREAPMSAAFSAEAMVAYIMVAVLVAGGFAELP
jgi:hypothetical protein